ncbi:MAG: LamG-like jellyroll fold domain-containing protein [Opitutaceae bacterium]|jgi:hypothetical protein
MHFLSPKLTLTSALLVCTWLTTTLPASTLAHWTFDNFSPGTRIDEVSGNGITLSAGANGMPKASHEAPSAAKIKASAVFTPDGGTGSHLMTASALPVFNFPQGQPFTIEGWFCLDALAETKPQTLVSNRGLPDGCTVAISQGKLLFQLQAGGQNLINLECLTTLKPQTWYFFAVSRGENGLLSASLYNEAGHVETVDSARAANGAINSSSKLYVGRRGDRQGAGDFLNGKISELRISDIQVPTGQLLFNAKK